MSRRLLQQTHVARSLPSRSPASSAEIRTRLTGVDLTKSDVHLKVLASPLRRCILTQKVLPKEMMVQLKLARLPAGKEPAQLILTPSSILHPRFSLPMPGKGAWVMCWKDAVDALAAKGSYKRVSSAATMPPSGPLRIHSQLARRIVQEAVMFAERVKSRPAISASGGLRACPVRRVEVADDGSLKGQEGNGVRLLALLDLSRVEIDGTASVSVETSAPTYQLARFFDTVKHPPIYLPPTSGAASTSPDDLVNSLSSTFDDLISVFVRRSTRDAAATFPPTQMDSAASATSPSPILYAICTPTDSADEMAVQEDAVPLLLSLYRMSLWEGKGWGDGGDPQSLDQAM